MIIVEKDVVCRQGDVLLVPCELPEGVELVSEGLELTIAYGEATGHHHTLYPVNMGVLAEKSLRKAKTPLVREFKDKTSGRRFVEIMAQMNLRHPDHDPEVNYKVLAPSIREIVIEQEENPFLDELVAVKD